MNETIERILSTGEVEDANGIRRPLGVSPVTAESGRLLHDLVRELRPARTIETGMAYALSTMYMCQAHRENGGGHHTAIDPLQESRYGSIGLLNVERAGLDGMLRFFPEPSDVVLPRLAASGERFDFAFIDGNHRFDHVMIDLFYIGRMLADGGHIAVDDLWLRGVRKAVSYFLRNEPYELVHRGSRTAAVKRVLRIGRRFAQDPLGRDVSLKLVPYNVAILRKIESRGTRWNHHRRF